MFRKMLIAAVAVLSLVFGALSVDAGAQTCATYNTCIAYPGGGFSSGGNSGAANTNTTATASPSAAAAATTTTTAASSNPNAANTIAFTGSESTVLGYVGAGLIGFGMVALGVRRKLTDLDD